LHLPAQVLGLTWRRRRGWLLIPKLDARQFQRRQSSQQERRGEGPATEFGLDGCPGLEQRQDATPLAPAAARQAAGRARVRPVTPLGAGDRLRHFDARPGTTDENCQGTSCQTLQLPAGSRC
jgi:hypothetical protein